MANFDIRTRVPNGSAPGLQPLYDAVNDLVNIAGHVTLDDLFNKSPDELGSDAWRAIHNAKRFGFLNVRNNACCSGKCQPSAKGWCSSTKSGDCAAASDPCAASPLALGPLDTSVEHFRDMLTR